MSDKAAPAHPEGWPYDDDGIDWQARAEAAEAENRCDVCDGRPLESGRKCMCGSTGKRTAAVQYLRERVVGLEAEVERLTQERNSARHEAKCYSQRHAHAELAEARRLLEELLDVLSRHRGPYEPLAAAPARYRTLTDAERAARAFLAPEGRQ